MNVIVVGYDIWARRVLDLLGQSGATYTLLTAGDVPAQDHPIISVETIDEAAFREAGIEEADAVLVATLDNQRNVLAVLTAADLATGATIVTFANERSDAPKLRRAGADTVVVIGQVIAELLVETALTDTDPEEIIDSILNANQGIETNTDIQPASSIDQSHS